MMKIKLEKNEPPKNEDILAWLAKSQRAATRSSPAPPPPPPPPAHAGSPPFKLESKGESTSYDRESTNSYELPLEHHHPRDDDTTDLLSVSVSGQESSPDNNNNKLHSLPPEPTPLGMIADLAIRDSKSRAGSSVGVPEDAEDEYDNVGVANDDYFLPGALFLLLLSLC
jgi:hypothetical protein